MKKSLILLIQVQFLDRKAQATQRSNGAATLDRKEEVVLFRPAVWRLLV